MPNPTFFLSVDTEADDQWSVEGRRRLSVQNVHCLPRLQTLCERYAVRPTYLVTHEMATTAESSDVLVQLRETGQCEIGAHLHPWSSPPFRDEDLRGSYPCQLPDALLERQLIELTEAIENHLGVRPTSYRAGRYGLDGRILQHLESLGYLVDSSVDPLFKERRLGGPSFAGAPIFPTTRTPKKSVVQVARPCSRYLCRLKRSRECQNLLKHLMCRYRHGGAGR